MKRTVCAMVLACAVITGAFAQARPAAPAAAPARREPKNAVAMDVFPLFKGFIAAEKNFLMIFVSASYERNIAPHFGIGPTLDFYLIHYAAPFGMSYTNLYFSLAFEGRYYPAANFDGLFIGTTLGFNVYSADGHTSADEGGFMGLTTSLKMGYKLRIGSIFYAEPSLSWVLSKFAADETPTPLGWQGGLRLGFTF